MVCGFIKRFYQILAYLIMGTASKLKPLGKARDGRDVRFTNLLAGVQDDKNVRFLTTFLALSLLAALGWSVFCLANYTQLELEETRLITLGSFGEISTTFQTLNTLLCNFLVGVAVLWLCFVSEVNEERKTFWYSGRAAFKKPY